jgi:hypothetical protein
LLADNSAAAFAIPAFNFASSIFDAPWPVTAFNSATATAPVSDGL